MAMELSISGVITLFNALCMSLPASKGTPVLQFNQTTPGFTEGSASIGTSPQAIPLGSVTTPHFAFFRNLDTTNYLTLQNGASGAVFLRLLPGELSVVALDPTCVPYATAHSAACVLEYLIANL